MLEAAQVVTRSNSDLCMIDLVSSDLHVDPEVRMAAIARIASGWERATADTPAQKKADETALKKYAFIPRNTN